MERVTLGTTEWADACKKLDKWWREQRELSGENPDNIPLRDILRRYWEAHGQYQNSAQSLKECLSRWGDYYGEISVGELTVPKQEAFIAFMRKAGLKPSSILRVLNVGKAALNRAHKRGELEKVPHILTVSVGKTDPKGRPLDVGELVAIYGAASPHVQDFIRWALGTAARPEAVLTLHSRQVDWVRKLVDLNPPDREQVQKKYRPIVRLPDALATPFEGLAVSFNGSRVASVKKGLWAACDRAGVVRCSSYSFRHTAARWMRSKGVPPWEVAAQLGHAAAGYSVTERYASHSPDYLVHAVSALDELIKALPESAKAALAQPVEHVIRNDVCG